MMTSTTPVIVPPMADVKVVVVGVLVPDVIVKVVYVACGSKISTVPGVESTGSAIVVVLRGEVPVVEVKVI